MKMAIVPWTVCVKNRLPRSRPNTNKERELELKRRGRQPANRNTQSASGRIVRAANHNGRHRKMRSEAKRACRGRGERFLFGGRIRGSAIAITRTEIRRAAGNQKSFERMRAIELTMGRREFNGINDEGWLENVSYQGNPKNPV
jgi:hypothetical protein